MLDTYRKLEGLGVIGKMMKVDTNGRPIIDLTGEQPGTLVVRPFEEFPKTVRRLIKTGETPEGHPIYSKKEWTVRSKSEELRLLAENPDNMADMPLSPLERERNELARANAEQNKTIMSMQEQMSAMMEQMAKLSQAIEKKTAEDVALGTGAQPVKVEAKPAQTATPMSGKTIEQQATAKKVV